MKNAFVQPCLGSVEIGNGKSFQHLLFSYENNLSLVDKGLAEGLKHAFQHFRASSHLENSSLHRNALGYTYAAIHFRMILSDREREKI